MALIRLQSVMLFLALLAFLHTALAAKQGSIIPYTTNTNEVIYLRDNRQPGLYTKSFGDCLGSGHSLVNISRFDAAYYADNMTVTFHLSGTTQLTNESVMLYIGVFAYGESRFELAFNPCGTNIESLCPTKAGVPIEANGFIPLGQQDVADIPSIALHIPDFEGQAIVRIFANSTESEIGCFTAVVSNGSSFNQQDSVGVVLGIFTIVAIAASFLSAIYGESMQNVRTHYAHSLSVMVVFAVFHHIYFTGALSMNWPSILVAFWANFAWAGGIIYDSGMQDSIGKLVGKYEGNTLAVGAAGSSTYSSNSVGGGYDVSKIYKRFEPGRVYGGSLYSPYFEKDLVKRSLPNKTTGFLWYGGAVRQGLPLPGNFSGFAGTLSEEGIPASNAFTTGFIWFLILLVIVAGSITLFKLALEGLYRRKVLNTNRLDYFRSHWRGYLVAALLRTWLISFFAMIFLALFQFTYNGAPAILAIAAIVFVIFLVGMTSIVGYACYLRLRSGKWISEPDKIMIERRRMFGCIPWFYLRRASTIDAAVEPSKKVFAGSFPFWRISHVPEESQIPVHEDEEYMKKFGWLTCRFRKSRWWFFAVWLGYEFLRACFYGGASGHPLVQVFGLLVVEFVAFMIMVRLRPFEGQRLNVMMIYLLGFSKVATVALSAAFDINFHIARIPATAIGVIIIVIQGLLTVALLISITLSAISSYFSITRNRETIRPQRWLEYRQRYFTHMEKAAADLPPPIPQPPPPRSELSKEPKGPNFSVNSVRRVAKIEDEDPEFQKEITFDLRLSSRMSSLTSLNALAAHSAPPALAQPLPLSRRPSRTMSINSNQSMGSLPFGAYVHRSSWSTREFLDYQAERDAASERYKLPNNSMPALSEPEPVARPGSRESSWVLPSLPLQIPSTGGEAIPMTRSSPMLGQSSSSPDLAAGSKGISLLPETPVRGNSPLVNVSNRASLSSPPGGPSSGPPSPARARFTRERIQMNRDSIYEEEAIDDTTE